MSNSKQKEQDMSASTAVDAVQSAGLITPEKPKVAKARKPKVGSVSIVPEASKPVSKPRRGKPIAPVAPTPEAKKPTKKVKLPKPVSEVEEETTEPVSKATEPLPGVDIEGTISVKRVVEPTKPGEVAWPVIVELEHGDGFTMSSDELFDHAEVTAHIKKSLGILPDGKVELFIWDWTVEDDDQPAELITYESWVHDSSVKQPPSKDTKHSKPVSWWFDPNKLLQNP